MYMLTEQLHCSALHAFLLTLVASMSAQACQSAWLLFPSRLEVPSLNHWRASSMYPISPASMAIAWYRCGLGRSWVALMPCRQSKTFVSSLRCHQHWDEKLY